jgi:hypothetical protein
MDEASAGDHPYNDTTATALSLTAFAAAGMANHPASRRAVEFLLACQDDEGCWLNTPVPFHRAAECQQAENNMRAVASTLSALSRWARSAMSAQSEAADEMSLRLVGATAEV